MKINPCFFGFPLLALFSAALSAQTVVKSTSADQVDVEVTVYNNNLGLIKETRKVDLPPGRGELRFMDVAAHINPVTVLAKSLNGPEDFTVLEQNYEYDLMNSEKLLDKYVGKKIKIIDWNKYQDRKEEVEAMLLSNIQGQIYEIGGEIYLGHPGYRVLPSLPENLIAQPTLTWIYDSGNTRPHQLEVSYLTTQISWKADYVVVLNHDDTAADLSGWVTLDNQSGAMYKNARLKLIAGDVHRVDDMEVRRYMDAKAMRPPEAQMEEKPFFEYHIYDLKRRTTIKDRQSKQVSLLASTRTGTQKELLTYGMRSYYSRQFRDDRPKQPVNVYIKFKNSEENNLGIPLPGGVMRLYKEDHEARLQFVGEDRVDHTPKNEEVRLKIGEAFDVVAERVQTDYQRITTRLHETAWEITVRNHKEEEVSVGIVEPLHGNWQIISNSHPYEKTDAFTIRFDVPVPADGEVKVVYRVRVGI